MATIIDSLIVTLGLDASGFRAGADNADRTIRNTGEEAERTGKKIKKTGADGGSSFSKMAVGAAKFLAVIGGTMAIKSFIEKTIESNAALDRLSKNLQENIETISAWSNSAELAGGSAEGLQGTLDMLSKAQTDLQLTGQSQLIPYFSALGVSIADASGKGRTGADIFLDLADRFSKMDRTTANNMGRMMGIDQGTMNLLLKGRKEVELMVAKQKEYNAVTKKQGEESSRLKFAMTEAKQGFSAFGRELVSSVLPGIEAFATGLSKVGNWVKSNQEFVKTFLTILGTGLAAIALAAMPINLVIVAVVGLAAAISALWQDYQVWKRGGESFIDWGKWEPGFTAAGKAIGWLKGLILDLVYRASAAADVLSAVFARDWKRAKFAATQVVMGNGEKYNQSDNPKEKEKDTSPVKPVAEKEKQETNTAPAQKETKSGTVNSKAKAGGLEQEQKAMEFFQKQGWTKEQSAGLAANIKRESAFDPNAIGDGGKAYGIAQWHPDRQAEFKKQYGKDIRESSIEDQMSFMNYELTKGNEKRAGDKLRATTTAADAAAAVSTHYERPADKAGEAEKRGKLAIAMMATPTPKTYMEKRKQEGIVDSPQVAQVTPSKSEATVAPEQKGKLYSTPTNALGGLPGASQAAQGAGAAHVAVANAPAPSAEVKKTVETHIGEVKVYTAATDANGIARDIGNSLDYLFTSQTNYGLS